MMEEIRKKIDADLVFEEEGHRYLYNGIQIPSVSKVLEPISGFAYSMIPEATLQFAARRGTAVHEAIEQFNNYGIMDVPEDFRAYTDAYEEWFCKMNPKVLATEMKFYNPAFLYAGTVDMLAEIGGKLCLVDFKTSSTVQHKTYKLQLEAYNKGLKAWDIDVKKKYVLHLTKDGKYEFIEYEANDSKSWKVFMALKTVYDYNNN